MAIIIGDKLDSDFNDPIGLLEDCHRRIKKFLDVLLAIANQAQGNPLTDEQQAAVETALRYFLDAAPKHTADEEESLFPRMRAAEHSGAAQILSDLDQLHADHITANENHRTVDELFHSWLANKHLSALDTARLTLLLNALRETYARHIDEEETQIFPHAARVLTPEDLKAVGLRWPDVADWMKDFDERL